MDSFTPDEKLSVVERYIERLRRNIKANPVPELCSSVVYSIIETTTGSYDLEILKSIAKDIDGKRPHLPSRAKDRLERAMNLHTDRQRLAKIAEVVQSEWATIRQALEQFKGET